MIELVAVTLGLALIDSLNPATITSMAILLPLLRKVEHALSYVASVYLVNYLGGVVLYFGVDGVLRQWLSETWLRHAALISAAQALAGLLLVAAGIGLYLRKASPSRCRQARLARPPAIRSLHPTSLFVFGVVTTLSDLPTAFPFIAFIGRMIEAQPSMATFAILLGVYVMIYVAPTLLLYGIFKVKREQMRPITRQLTRLNDGFARFVLPALVAALGIWLAVGGLARLL